MKPQRNAKEMIQEGFDEYYFEKIVSPQLEREMMQNYEKHENIAQERKYQGIVGFVESYMKDNPQPTCEKCYKKECELIGGFSNECGYVGLQVVEHGNYFDVKKPLIFSMKKIQKGVWDEIFVPLKDSDIERIVGIY